MKCDVYLFGSFSTLSVAQIYLLLLFVVNLHYLSLVLDLQFLIFALNKDIIVFVGSILLTRFGIYGNTPYMFLVLVERAFSFHWLFKLIQF